MSQGWSHMTPMKLFDINGFTGVLSIASDSKHIATCQITPTPTHNTHVSQSGDTEVFMCVTVK